MQKWVNFRNLYQHAEIEVVSSICSEEIFDLKILQSDWLRGFWPTSQKDFSQIWDLWRNAANNINFWPISQSFGTKKNLLKYLGLSRTTSLGFLVTRQNLKKTSNDRIPRQRPDRQKDGQEDGRILDHVQPKITKIPFRFHEFASAWKKLVYSICSFFRYSQI